MILPRALQVLGVLALLMCGNLAWGATPWGGEGWARGRLLYAGAGAVSALTLVAIGALGLAARRAEQERAALAERLARIEALLRERA